jgi:ABC-2 type transport system permease protein
MAKFSFARWRAIISKEFRQMRRDRLTFAMLVAIPLLQLILFGFAINANPRHLPTAIVSADHSPLTRTFLTAVQNTKYFRIINNNADEKTANRLLQSGRATFVITIPQNFSHDLIAGLRPSILVTSDATDAMATANASSALTGLAKTVFNPDLSHGLPALIPSRAPFNLIIHAKYNPELITQYSIVPGLLGVVLTMTLVMITALAITRERERGTMESLLATPVQPLEVMLGKIVPYIIVGYVQMSIIVLFSLFLFHIPFVGNLLSLVLASLAFIAANLMLGLLFSTIAKNQLQAVQMTFFFFLPSILLSGFMFPFYGMPNWAQAIGNCLPLTHFLRIVRGIMLKNITAPMVWHDTWPILIFMLLVIGIGAARFKRRLE